MAREKFELFKGKKADWYFRLKSPNGKIICQSEGYKTEQGAMNGIKAVKTNAAKAKIVVI